MRVKIFQGFGRDEIDDLERRVNRWLARHDNISVKNINCSAAGGLGMTDEGETFQTLIMTVCYDGGEGVEEGV